MSSPLKPPPHPAPWHSSLKSHLSTLLPSPEFVLATLSFPNDRAGTGVPEPRARYCIFRGFWCDDIDLHESTLSSVGKDTLNPKPGVYESEMLTITTDARMGKVGELSSNVGGGSGDGGGGGDVEAVFWVKGLMSQWRVRGKAYVVGGDVVGGEEGEERARREVKAWMRRREESGGEEGKEWTWEREVTAHFANLSPVMRGSFKNPPPGTPMPKNPSSEPNSAPKLGQPVYDLHDPIARNNFRVVIILPEVVEWVNLETPEKAMRKRWTLTTRSASSGDREAMWEEVELWP